MLHRPISVQALRTRARCARQFALQYVQGLSWPGPVRPPDADMRLGDAFHKLVVRHRLGMPVNPPAELADLWARFLASPHARPHGAAESGDPALRVLSEQTLQFSLEGVPFLVRCDEIRREGANWTILDWKTGHVREADLARDWQTRLYRFALAMAGTALGAAEGIPPENIKMVYLLVRLEKEVAFPYDRPSFEADRALFTDLARQAGTPAEALARPDDPLTCRACRFDTLCNGRPARTARTAASHDVHDVPRFVFQEKLD